MGEAAATATASEASRPDMTMPARAKAASSFSRDSFASATILANGSDGGFFDEADLAAGVGVRSEPCGLFHLGTAGGAILWAAASGLASCSYVPAGPPDT